MSTHAAPVKEAADLFDSRRTPSSIVLIGFMGSGKSSVARNLAKRFACENIDLDAKIEARGGQSIANFFAHHGEDAFRRLESEVLASALDDMARNGGVLATGGGIAKSESNRKLLQAASQKGGAIVYLRARPETLARRIRRQPGKRPLIDGGGVLDMEQTLKRVQQLIAEREADYRACANFVLDTDTLSPRRVVDIIAARVQEPAR